MRRLRVLHAIHDFLPRHRAGSEIYACDLATALSARHDVFVAAAEYDPSTAHGTIRWKKFAGLPVIEIVNNWEFDTLDESYSSARLNQQLRHVLDAVRPDVVHVHNLLNLSFDLPRLARERGIPSVATLHDYTLLCASGGQRVHAAESHVCTEIDAERCSRCYRESPLGRQMAAGTVMRGRAGRAAGRLGAVLRRAAPRLTLRVASGVPAVDVSAGDIRRRLAAARSVFANVDLFVAPSAAIAREFARFGLPPERAEVSDYGFTRRPRAARAPREHTTFGFVGTPVWHKGVHVLLAALAHLEGRFEARIFGDLEVFPHYSDELKKQARGLPVAFMGAFDRADVPKIYASFDVLVVPSLWPENSPLVIHEAMMHGAAVVGARIGGIPELVSDGLNGVLYEPFSVMALAAALQRFVDEPALAGRFASRAPRVKSIDEDAAEWERRYERVIAARSPSGEGAPA